MELLLTDEQTLLRDSAATFAERRGGAAGLRALRTADAKIDRGLWREAAEAGWLAILADESAGGLGLGLTELCLVTQELGKKLIPLPVGAVAATAAAIGDADTVTRIVAGDRIVLPALAEGPRMLGDEAPGTAASPDTTLSGSKHGVPYAGNANGFLVSGSAGGSALLYLVDTADISIETAPTMDGAVAGRLVFDGTAARPACGPNEAPAALARLLDAMHLAAAAELLGIMEGAHAIALDYLKVREQFGKPIGAFQALQHRAVDSLAAIEMCRSLIYQAASAIDARGSTPGLASAAMSLAARNAMTVTKTAIQMHGGIGFTDEHDIGLYLKRAMTLTATYGNAGLHRKRYAESAA
jgi:alkylation response protein AidB-like acyl-CoA dehydrogenase